MEHFHCHSGNESNFVSFFRKKLEQTDCCVIYTTGDADCDIAVTAANDLLWKDVSVISEDTDLVSVNSFFLSTARLWNSLPARCFLLTYDLGDLRLELIDIFFFFFFL